MMTNLFSIFDPSNFLFNLNWILFSMVIMIPIFFKKSKMNNLSKETFKKFFLETINLNNSNKISNMMMSLFSLILLINLISMVPFSFTITSQISTIFPMGISFWMSINLFNLIKKTQSFFSHLTPENSPLILSPFLIIIEMVSNIIRPITISVRLLANMTAGHLLMHLLSEFSCFLFPMSFLIIPISMILFSLELMVCLIQSYIFCTLVSMYSNEIH